MGLVSSRLIASEERGIKMAGVLDAESIEIGRAYIPFLSSMVTVSFAHFIKNLTDMLAGRPHRCCKILAARRGRYRGKFGGGIRTGRASFWRLLAAGARWFRDADIRCQLLAALVEQDRRQTRTVMLSDLSAELTVPRDRG